MLHSFDLQRSFDLLTLLTLAFITIGLSGGSDTTLSIARESGSWVAATVPITSYSGDDTQMEVHNLIPNRTYQFRVRFIGSRSNSAFSDPVTVLTKPLPPSPGIVLDVSPTGVRVKWYPPQYGAMKFLVELMQVNSTPGSYPSIIFIHIRNNSNPQPYAYFGE